MSESCFNPRSREGSDKNKDRKIKQVFQSTLPRGERRTRSRLSNPRSREGSDRPISFCFNPRSREGSDSSLHTPKVFNPRSREGSDLLSTPNPLEATVVLMVSIHAPARGATPCQVRTNRFNPRSREGSDEICCNRIHVVSIHAPARGATPLL